jgi:hypothetical protein
MALFSRAFIRKRVISLVTTISVAATSFALARDPAGTHQALGAAPIQYVADRGELSPEQSFLSDNKVAMDKMMADMTIQPTGDVDRDFVEMMVPHHLGAVAMAQAELEYGHNAQLRRLAQEIVVTQQHETTVMRLALGDSSPQAVASPTGAGPALPAGAMSSSMGGHDAMSHQSMDMK